MSATERSELDLVRLMRLAHLAERLASLPELHPEPNPDQFQERDRRGRLRWLTETGDRRASGTQQGATA